MVEPAWTFETGLAPWPGATFADGLVYAGDDAGRLHALDVFALDAATGERRWRADVFGWAWGQPAVTEERVFMSTSGLRGYSGDTRRGGFLALAQ